MGFVVAAYLIVAALFAAYVVTLIGRQRLIAEMADAAASPREPA
jgi:hypothetical protein